MIKHPGDTYIYFFIFLSIIYYTLFNLMYEQLRVYIISAQVKTKILSLCSTESQHGAVHGTELNLYPWCWAASASFITVLEDVVQHKRGYKPPYNHP